MSDLVEVLYRGKVAWLYLNRPREMNALSRALVSDLENALDEVAASKARALVLTGRGRAFCAGGDLTEFLASLEESETVLLEQLRDNQIAFEKLATFGIPTFAAINGICIAGGLELALTCDFILATTDAQIADGHARYGVQPGGGGTTRLARRISLSRAKWMMFSGDYVPPDTLRDWGLLHEVIDPERFEDVVQEKASILAEHSPLLLGNMKQLLEGNYDRSVEDGDRAELETFRTYAKSHDLREGLSVLRQKRPPKFNGT